MVATQNIDILGPIWTFSLSGVLTFVASGLDINGCVLNYFERAANLHCYTSCTLTTLHCSKVLFLQCCHMKRYNKIFTKVWGEYSLLWDIVYIHIYAYKYIYIVVKAPLREGFYSDIIWAVSLVKLLLLAEVYICQSLKGHFYLFICDISCSCYLEVLVIDLQVSLFALCFCLFRSVFNYL